MATLYTIVISCPDKKGIVAAVSGFIAQHGGFIEDADQHSDHASDWFFMRLRVELGSISCSVAEFFLKFHELAEQYRMQVRSRAEDSLQRVVLMVSKAAHCLEDILYRWRCGELPAQIVGVISNHDILRERTQWYGLPFYHCPIVDGNKQEHFAQVEKILLELEPDLVVLARYMQIMPEHLCAAYAGRMINIHHSFLPSFVGASPYKQAFLKGVKLIGATSHYVTADLDQGPIIEQGVTRITHRQSLQDYIRMGSDVERAVLSKALLAHLQERVVIFGQKTVVFEA